MASLHGVFRGLLNGRHERGTGGVLYVKDDKCAYRFPHEFPDVNFRERLAEILSDDEEQHLFVVEDKQDGKLHLLAYPIGVVQSAVEDAFHTSNAASNAASDAAPDAAGEENLDKERGTSGQNNTTDSNSTIGSYHPSSDPE